MTAAAAAASTPEQLMQDALAVLGTREVVAVLASTMDPLARRERLRDLLAEHYARTQERTP